MKQAALSGAVLFSWRCDRNGKYYDSKAATSTKLSDTYRLLAALGAFLTLAVAGVGPFVQQILTQEVVAHQLDGTSPTVPIFNWTSPYSGDSTMANPAPNPNDGWDVEDPGANSGLFDDAFYTGLIAATARDFPVTPNCVAANCTWEPYWTFVVESECRNISSLFNRSSEAGAWILPNDMAVPFPIGPPMYNISTNYASVAFADRGHLISDFFITTTGGAYGTYYPSATECILQLRARKVQAQYENGKWSETQIGSSLLNNSLAARGCSPWRRSIAGYYFEAPDLPDPTNETYPNATTGQDPLLDLWYLGPDPDLYWTSTCNVTIVTNSSDPKGDLIFPAIHLKTPASRLHYLLDLQTSTAGEDSYANSDKIGGILNKLISLLPSYTVITAYFVDRPNNITLEERVDNIAKSLTQALRSNVFSDQIYVSGDAYKDTIVYKVTWYWIIVPGSLVVLTLVLLVLTAWDTFHKGLTKRTDSSLALIAFGCDQQIRKMLTAAGDLDAISKFAKKQHVRLGADHVLTLAEDSQDSKVLGKEGKSAR